ncbi:MAG: haloacid dehalogenase type II [Acidobacteria bacterium]|nr:haloacid dehalogenase type II [Acidobacteriota bacterium]
MPGIKLNGIRACVFDAYGTLFDVNSAAEAEKEVLAENWKPLADTWRTKQLQYTWLRALMRRHADFWQVTGDALDFAMAESGLSDPALRQRLMDLYLRLNAYPEVKSTLEQLKQRGMQLAILSNGAPRMLAAAAENAAITGLLDAILSVEEVRTFKPNPAVYQLAVDRLGLAPREICFLSSNSWDAYAAKAFGFQVLWCNRFGQPPERIPETPDGEIGNLRELLEWV